LHYGTIYAKMKFKTRALAMDEGKGYTNISPQEARERLATGKDMLLRDVRK
jgi:hypothetical protein